MLKGVPFFSREEKKTFLLVRFGYNDSRNFVYILFYVFIWRIDLYWFFSSLERKALKSHSYTNVYNYNI